MVWGCPSSLVLEERFTRKVPVLLVVGAGKKTGLGFSDVSHCQGDVDVLSGLSLDFKRGFQLHKISGSFFAFKYEIRCWLF